MDLNSLNTTTIERATVIHGDSLNILSQPSLLPHKKITLSFLDPPFNQGKEYENHDDLMDENSYWNWMTQICSKIYELTIEGGSLYFMHREKKAEQLLKTLRTSGWTFQNLIIWKKKTSAVPQKYRFGKQYQIIAFATKGSQPKRFNRLRIDYPLAPHHKQKRENGIYVTDVWDDIRELTSGYFAGDEALRDSTGKRMHKQQSPIALLLRIILASSLPNDVILDPFAGTGTTLVVANQLKRYSIGIELGSQNYELIIKRLKSKRIPDNIMKYYSYYQFTEDLAKIWGTEKKQLNQKTLL